MPKIEIKTIPGTAEIFDQAVEEKKKTKKKPKKQTKEETEE